MPTQVVSASESTLPSPAEEEKSPELPSPSPDAGEDATGLPTTDTEVIGFYAYDWGSSAVSTVVISGFWPLLVQNAGLEAAGFPEICGNVLTNLTTASFANCSGVSAESEGFLFRNDITDSLVDRCCGDICAGYPETSSECLQSNGEDLFKLRVSFAGSGVDPSAFASIAISLSVLLQAVVFVSVGAMADFSSNRRLALQVTTYTGALFCILIVATTQDTWWLGGLFGVIANVLYGATFVFYNPYLVDLAKGRPSVLNRDLASREGQEALQEEMDYLSARGFAYGYAGSIVMMALAVVIAFLIPSNIAFPLNCALAGLWWIAFATYTFTTMRPRQGAPYPEGAGNVVLFSWQRTVATISRARELPHLFFFLITWFVYSDGFSVVASVGALYANTEVDFGFSKTLALTSLLLVPPIFAGIGNFFFEWVQARTGFTEKQMIAMNLGLICLVPLYGLLGFASSTIGLRSGLEMYIAVALYGLNLGSVQSYSRTLYASLIPPGRQSEMFALYELSDKGSSWLGPLVVAVIAQNSGVLRYGFIYVVCMLLLPIGMLYFVDVDVGRTEALQYDGGWFSGNLKAAAGVGAGGKGEGERGTGASLEDSQKHAGAQSHGGGARALGAPGAGGAARDVAAAAHAVASGEGGSGLMAIEAPSGGTGKSMQAQQV